VHVDAVDVFNTSELLGGQWRIVAEAKVAHWDPGGVLLTK
jgi:hypothetical protein